MTGYGYEPGRMQAFGRPPVQPVPMVPEPRYGWTPTPSPAARASRAPVVALALAGAALLVARCALAVVLVGVGGPHESFVRDGALGLPLMSAIIGGETHRFRPLVDLYREAGRRAGHSPEQLRVGLHSLGLRGPHHAGGRR